MAVPLLTHRGVVYPWQCDHMGHMNVMWYVGKFDEATWQLLAAAGFTPDTLRQSGRGLVAVEQTLQYKRELLAGDTLSIYSGLLEVGDKTIRFRHEMRHDGSGELAATAVLVGVHIDTTLRKACPISAAIRAQAAALVMPA